MTHMQSSMLRSLIASVLILALLAAPVFAQLPDGPGKATTQQVCANCHELDIVTGAFSYTGSFIAARLLEQGRRVRTLTRRDDPTSPLMNGVTTSCSGSISVPPGAAMTKRRRFISCACSARPLSLPTYSLELVDDSRMGTRS